MPLVELQSRGRTLNYETGGPGEAPTVLFIDGTGSDLRDGAATALIAEFAERGFQTICFDHRGLGLSADATDTDEDNWTMQDFADDAAALLTTLGRGPCNVVGWSFGGMVAMQLAVRNPELVARLALVCCSPGGEGGSSYPLHEMMQLSLEEQAAKQIPLLDTRNKVTDDAVAQSVTFLRSQHEKKSQTPGALVGEKLQLMARARHDCWEQLGNLTSRTLVLAGEFDGIADAEISRSMANRIPTCEFRQFAGSHLMIKFGNQKAAIFDAIASLFSSENSGV